MQTAAFGATVEGEADTAGRGPVGGWAPKEMNNELGILQWVVVGAVKGLLWARGGKRERRHLRSAEGPGEERGGKLKGTRADSARGLWRHHIYDLVFCLLPFKVTQLHTALQSR